MKKIGMALAAVCATVISSGAMAQAYVGGAVGAGKVNLSCEGTDNCDRSGTAYKLFGGYSVAGGGIFEAGFLNFGNLEGNIEGISADLKTRAFTISAGYRGEIANGWGVNARLGLAKVKSELSLLGISVSQTEYKPYVGLGVNYALTKQIRLEAGADFTRGELSEAKYLVRAFTAGVSYDF
jgi:OmpA-OmpF porin, OOP family